MCSTGLFCLWSQHGKAMLIHSPVTCLPVPLLEAFDPALASKLYSEGYDTLCLMRDTVVLKAAAIEAATAVFINLIISVLHGFFFDPQKYESRELYEVKTRKILSISNLIASASNVIWVGGNALAGNEFAWENVDIGGLIVTAHRLITDTKFINQVKSEYLEKHGLMGRLAHSMYGWSGNLGHFQS